MGLTLPPAYGETSKPQIYVDSTLVACPVPGHPEQSILNPATAIYPSTFSSRDTSPQLIFNARTGKLFWYDPSVGNFKPKKDGQNGNETQGNGEKYILLNSVGFTPPTSIRERVLLQVCGLRYGAQPTVVPVSKAVVGNLPELASFGAVTNSAAIAAASAITKASGTTTAALTNSQPMIEYLGKTPPEPTKKVTGCAATPAAIATAVKKDVSDTNDNIKLLRQALSDYDTSSEKIGIDAVNAGLGNKKLESILTAVEGQENLAGTSITAFNQALNGTLSVASRAAALAAAYSSAVQGSHFKSIKSASESIKSNLEDLVARSGSVCNDLSATVKEAEDNARASFQERDEKLGPSTGIWKALGCINLRIATLSSKLNDDYANSAVTSLQLLDLPSDNAIVSVSITISDPWTPIIPPTPFAPGDPLTGDAQGSSNPAPKTTETTITISNDEHTITIKSPVVPSASSALPNAPSVIVTPTAKPAVSVQVSGAPSSPSTASANSSDQTSSSNPTNTQIPATSPSATSQPDTTFLMGRHHILYFLPTGGFLLQKATNTSYGVETLATSITTTTKTVTTPPNNGQPTTVITSAASAGSANFAYATGTQSLQYGAVVGLTFFPGGVDTYKIAAQRTSGHLAYLADFWPRWQKLGIFVGTTVNTLGTFLASGTYELTPGIELYGGYSTFSSNQILQGVTPCASLGTGSSNTATQNLDPQQDSSGNSIAVTITTTTHSPCNTQAATPLSTASATTAPSAPTGTNTTWVPSFGILLNSNLFAALGLIKGN